MCCHAGSDEGRPPPDETYGSSARRSAAPSRLPPIPEFIEMIADSGAKLYACMASVDLFNLARKDFIHHIEGIITVGELYQMAGGSQIIFT